MNSWTRKRFLELGMGVLGAGILHALGCDDDSETTTSGPGGPGGTGGNPAKIKYAEVHTGNVCTEDLVVMFEGMGVDTGLKLGSLLPTALRCEAVLGRELAGRVTRAGLGLVGSK